MTSKFTTTDNFIIRQPLYPINVLRRILEDSSKMFELFESEDFKRSILWVSKDLYEEYIKFLSESLSVKDENRMSQTLLKYAIRMTTRSTPFGEFASVGVGFYAGNTKITNPIRKKKWISLDAVLERLLFERIVRSEFEFKHSWFKYVLNGTMIRKGQYWHYLCTSLNGRLRFVVLDNNRILDKLLNGNKKVYTFNEIKFNIFGDSDIEENVKNNFILSLINKEIILPFYRPEAMCESWIKRMMPYIRDLSNPIIVTSELLKTIDSQTSADEIYNQLVTLSLNITDQSNNLKNIVQVVSYSSSNYKISEEVRDKILNTIEFFSKITPRKINVNIQNFIRDFQERYYQQAVSLLEVLNPEIGIGYGDSCVPSTNELVKNLNTDFHLKYSKHTLLNKFELLMQRKMAENNSSAIVLTDDDVKDLHPRIEEIPASISAVFNILGDKDDIISELHFSGSSATCLIGRFTLGEKKIRSIANSIAIHEANYYEKNGIIAEVNLLPNIRCGNVNYRSKFRKYRICNNNSTFSYDIPLSDLVILIEDGMIKLKSKKIGAFIIPRLSSAHNNYAGSDVVYQFLGDIQSQGECDGLFFSWGNLRCVHSHFPRVYYNDIIISLEEWSVDTSLFKEQKRYTSNKYLEWVRQNNLPRYIKLIDGDNELFVDNNCELSVRSLMRELKKHPKAYFREVPGAEDSMIKQKVKYLNQIIMPILKFN